LMVLMTACECEMILTGVVCHLQALEKFTVEKDIAAYIKKEFDKKHGPTWHCIVGRHFGDHPLPLKTKALKATMTTVISSTLWQ